MNIKINNEPEIIIDNAKGEGIIIIRMKQEEDGVQTNAQFNCTVMMMAAAAQAIDKRINDLTGSLDVKDELGDAEDRDEDSSSSFTKSLEKLFGSRRFN